MIIETSSNHLYRVTECPDADLAHCWQGYRVKRTKAGYVNVKNARMTLVRRAQCKIIEGDAS